MSTAVYGRGVFFVRHANYAATDKFSPRDNFSNKYVFVVKVLTGELAKYDVQLSSASTQKTQCYCGVDDVDNPTIFVIYDDTQAYPEYLITFI